MLATEMSRDCPTCSECDAAVATADTSPSVFTSDVRTQFTRRSSTGSSTAVCNDDDSTATTVTIRGAVAQRQRTSDNNNDNDIVVVPGESDGQPRRRLVVRGRVHEWGGNEVTTCHELSYQRQCKAAEER
jgi:hypothetical protein